MEVYDVPVLEVTATAIHKWEKKKTERLSKINETVIRAFFADQLGISKTFKFSDLNRFSEIPDKVSLKAS